MTKEKYKVLVETYFNKDERKSYTKGSIVELNSSKGSYLEKIKAVKKINSKEKEEIENASRNNES